MNLERSVVFRPFAAPRHAWPVLPREDCRANLEPGVAYWWHWYERVGRVVYEMAGSGAADLGIYVRRVAECTTEDAAVAALRMLST